MSNLQALLLIAGIAAAISVIAFIPQVIHYRRTAARVRELNAAFDGWTCHVCGEMRPDEFISVESHSGAYAGSPTMTVSYIENVRYCNDRPACAEAAKTYHFIEGS